VSTAGHGWTDQRVEQIVGNLLRAGVLTAAGVVLVGAALYLAQYGATVPDYEKFKGEPPGLRLVPEIAADALTLDGKAVIQVGILLLLATPVARVAFSVVAFALQRDRLYVLVTLLVLAVLLFSLSGVRP
jgi:uncharacterized membrane protein